MRIRTLLAGALLLPVFALAPGAGRAQMAVVNPTLEAKLPLMVEAITRQIRSSATTIVNALGSLTEALLAQVAKSAEMAAESQVDTSVRMEQERQNARYQQADACAVLAPSRGAQEAMRTTSGLGGGSMRGGPGSPYPPGGLPENMWKAIQVANRLEPAPSPEQQATQAASGACTGFVTKGSNPLRSQTCEAAGFKLRGSIVYPDADIRAATLMHGPQRAEQADSFRSRLTMDPDGADRVAVEAYLRNLGTPVDLAQLKPADLNRQAGRQYMTYRDAYVARMELAALPWRTLVQNRTANPALRPMVMQLLKGEVSGPFVADYLARSGYDPHWKTRGISVDEMFNLEAEVRYRNPHWHVKMASLPPEAHLREQTTLLAFQVVQQERIARKLDSLAVVLGQVAASEVRKEMAPQLTTLYQQAVQR